MTLKLKNAIYFLLLLILGLIIFFYHTLTYNFDRMPGDSGDALLVNYIFEHFWLWLHQIPQHLSFWNMPFYYPRENTLAYSDIMIGGAIIYIPVRFFIKNPFTTLQIWLALICIANYTTFYFLLRKFKFDALPSAVGAFIFAFGVMRYFKLNHLNYFIQYPLILSIFCLTYFKEHKHLSLIGFFSFLSLQFWSVYSLGYLFCFTLFIAGFFIPFKTVCFIKKYYKELLCYNSLFILSVIPLALHYLALDTVRSYGEVLYFLVDPTIWIRNISILDNLVLRYLPDINHVENCGGIGIITFLTGIYGILLFKEYRKIILSTLILLMIICSKFGDFSIWELIYNIFPGANGIRVVSRICFIFLIMYCFGIANFFQNAKKMTLVILTMIIIIIEQLPYSSHTYLWSKSAAQTYITKASSVLPAECKVLYSENIHKIGAVDLLTMWIASENNIYSANGSSGIEYQKIWQDEPEYCICNFDFENFK